MKKNLEYKMSSKLYHSLLKGRNAAEKKRPPQEYLCNVVNENFGLKGKVTRVIIG